MADAICRKGDIIIANNGSEHELVRDVALPGVVMGSDVKPHGDGPHGKFGAVFFVPTDSPVASAFRRLSEVARNG